MYDQSRQTDPSMDIPVYMNTMNAHFNALGLALEERFTAVNIQQDRIEKSTHTINGRLDRMETDIHTLQTDVRTINGRLDRVETRLDRMETLMQTIVQLLQAK